MFGVARRLLTRLARSVFARVLARVIIGLARRALAWRRAPSLPSPPRTYRLSSANHRPWLEPGLLSAGWAPAEAPSEPTFVWELRKSVLPKPGGARVFNSLPNLMHLDDKAVLGLLSRGFTRTRPLATHVLYGEWDDERIGALQRRWAEPGCAEPHWWIVKDAHSSNGFSAALLDRRARPLRKKDVAGGYCYVVQEYVDAPLLLDGRKFELRQYVLLRGDGSAFTYERALMRFASVEYDLHSSDRRAHITNKWVQTGWEAANELCGLDEIERVSTRWPAYEALLTERITPLLCDLVDAVGPLLRSGLRAVPASASAHHFELFACDLVVRASGEPVLMEVNINPAFGTFTDATVAELMRPLWADLLALCVLPAAGAAPRAGGFRRLRPPWAEAPPPADDDASSAELRDHFMYCAFKKSHRKRYERKVGGDRPLLLSG